MSVYTQHLQYRKVLALVDANASSDPILTTDFKTIKMSLKGDSDSDYDIVVYGSYNPSYGPVPDLSNPTSPTNEYHLLGYTDESDGANYAAGSPYNPGGAFEKGFNIETTGINWIIVAIENYADGIMEFCHVDLYSNFN